MASRAEARRRKILENSEDRLKRLTGQLENDIDENDIAMVTTEQAKLETRAEARRRKILEKSDERLKLVKGQLGRTSDVSGRVDKEDILHEASPGPDCVSENTENNKELIQPSEKAWQDGNIVYGGSRKLTAGGDIREDSKAHTEDVQGKTLSNDRLSGNAECITGVRNRHVPAATPSSPLNETSEPSSQSTTTSSNAAEIIREIEITRLISCVLAAVFSRWLLPTLLGYLVLQSSAVVFLAVEVGLFVHQRQLLQTVVLPHKSNLMAGALLLCGIKPELITTYNRIIGIASTLFEDLMVFYFTFITCHLLSAS